MPQAFTFGGTLLPKIREREREREVDNGA